MDLSTIVPIIVISLVAAGLAATIGYEYGKKAKQPKYSDHPIKPNVAFPFEPLTELVETCAAKFSATPIRELPKIFISPAQYFPRHKFGPTISQAASEAEWIFYHKLSNAIYVADDQVNKVDPKRLADAITIQLGQCWLYQRVGEVQELAPNHPTYLACVTAVTKMLGLERQNVQV